MKGLTYVELVELLQYIEEHHSWKNMAENHFRNGTPSKTIKYVRFYFDTRGCDVWHVELDQITNSNEFTKTFRTEMGYNLKEEIYKYLKTKEVI